MSFLFINQQDIDDWKDQIEEEFGLKSPKKNSKDNNEKKETVEDRIIKRCEMVQKGGSLLLDQVPRWGAIKSAIEFKTGKDYITDETLTPEERKNCAKRAVAGIGDFLPNGVILKGRLKEVVDKCDDKKNWAKKVVDFVKELNEIGKKNRNRNKNRSRSRSREQSESKKRGRPKTQRKKK